MPKVFTSKTQITGEIGEKVAVKFLMKHGFSIIERNYTKKWGEIDIIAQKDTVLHFVEVKSVARETISDRAVLDQYRPEDNMHPQKMRRMARTIQTYLLGNKISEDKEWQVDLVVVFLDLKNKKAKVKVVKNIIL